MCCVGAHLFYLRCIPDSIITWMVLSQMKPDTHTVCIMKAQMSLCITPGPTQSMKVDIIRHFPC